jgi:hypothetical protein
VRDERGRFLPGPDPDRHFLSKWDCRKGYYIATQVAKLPRRVRAWLRSKIRRYYHGRRPVAN